MQKIYFLFVLFSLCFTTLEAQELKGICGNTYEDQMSQIKRYDANLKKMKSGTLRKSGNVTYIPIQFHIVTRDNGTGGLLMTELLEQLCIVNEQFGEFDINFFMLEPRILNSDIVYEDHSISSGQFRMRQFRNRDAVNIWMVNNATPASGGVPIGITLGYYDTFNDWIVIRRNQISAANNTLSHEIGHFFSLFHPHLGWDGDPYDPNRHGLQVTDRAPNGGVTELVDRSNCEDAGDKLCDTEPDYNFALRWDCPFNVDVRDPKGDLVDPDETLIMSYFNDACTSRFTESQIGMMQADVESSSRNFLSNDYVPLAASIEAVPTLRTPAEGAVTSSFNKVELRWDAIAGADQYLVEVDINPNFNIRRFQFVANQNSIVLEDILEADRTYRWRVTPFNPSFTCSGTSEVSSFTTGLTSSVPTISAVDDWTIQPNPIQSSSEIAISIQAKNAFDANLNVINLTGQIVAQQSNLNLPAGRTTIPMEIGDLPKGVYLVSLENGQGVLNKKLVVQ